MYRLTGLALLIILGAGRPAAAQSLNLVPQPSQTRMTACAHEPSLARGIAFAHDADAGGREIIRERWDILGIPAVADARAPRVRVRRDGSMRDAYRLRVGYDGVSIDARDAEGAFDGLATLAQLPHQGSRGWTLPCITITDRPALRWRIVSDDVSRGPLPTMRYFHERIRSLAALKMNGYSPYMEHVFVDAAHPLVAPADGIRPDELRELAAYARRYHVALIPEQQTFAHMHETLKFERYASLAELPHGYLLNPADPATYAFLRPLLNEELDAAGAVPFFHIGSDEPLDLGRGKSATAVSRDGTPAVFAAHVRRVESLLGTRAGRPMIWDDAVQRDAAILGLIPRSTVIVDFHYGVERSYRGYIDRVAGAGFEQMVSPGANNWNEFYPLLDVSSKNIAGFVADGKAANVLGMFMTVWHDDGQSLYEATWYPLAYAAANAWQAGTVDRPAFDAAFAGAFFGAADASANARIVADVSSIAFVQQQLASGEDRDSSDYLMWSDPFDARLQGRLSDAALAAIRLRAEAVIDDLRSLRVPLHRNAVAVLELAAMRYDALARRLQIAREARAYYADALEHADGSHDGIVYRGLNVAKYLCWEMRDATLALAERYRRAWVYESREGALDRVLVRFRLDAERSMRYADRLDAVQREDYLRTKHLPSFDQALGLR